MSDSAWQPLIPFGAPPSPAPQVVARVDRDGAWLRLAWRITGPATAVRRPPPAGAPARRDELWRHTCLEAFVGSAGAPAYWEVNVAPSGDWNLYRFDGYPTGMAAEERSGVTASVRDAGDVLAVSATVDVGPLGLAASALDVALTAVVEDAAGARTYWALRHGGPEPDFHRRDGFVVRLAEVAA